MTAVLSKMPAMLRRDLRGVQTTVKCLCLVWNALPEDGLGRMSFVLSYGSDTGELMLVLTRIAVPVGSKSQ